MLKALTLDSNGRHIVMLGVTADNLIDLTNGPEQRLGADISGIPDVDGVVLVYGHTDRDILARWEAQGLVPAGTAEQLGRRIDELKEELGDTVEDVRLQ